VRSALFAALCAALLASSASFADEEKSRLERAGNCNDAKSQMAYFCKQDDGTDTMVTLGTACNNAKSNVKSACEGIDTPDPEYKFEDRKK
jgi:hypothetical protein